MVAQQRRGAGAVKPEQGDERSAANAAHGLDGARAAAVPTADRNARSATDVHARAQPDAFAVAVDAADLDDD